MTVPSLTDYIQLTGPQTNPIAIPFRFLQNADLLVQVQDLTGTITTLVLTTDYTLTGAGDPSGGTLTLVAGNLTTGYILFVLNNPSPIQGTSLPNGGPYFGSAVERALDLITLILQAQAFKISRAPQVPGTGTVAAFPSPLALALIGWNAAANGLTNYPIASLGSILAAGNFKVDSFSAGTDYTPGSTTTLPLSQAPGTVNNTLILFDGVPQQKATYSVAGAVVTFTSAIPYGVLKVEVTQSGVLPINTPADNSVATATIQNLAVDQTKMADNAVPTRVLQDRSVTLAKFASDATQGGKNGIINGAAIVANGADYVASVSGTYGYGKSELCKGALTGTTVAGTLTAVTASSCGRTGCAFKWSAITTTGAGITKMRFFIEAKDAIAYKNQLITVACQVRQDTGGAINFAIVVSKANALNDFSATTVISTGANVSVPSAINTNVYNRGVSMGDCSNGVMVEITGAIGAVTNKNVEMTELQLEFGSYETNFEYEPIAITYDKVCRYFEKLGNNGDYGIMAAGQAITTSTALYILTFKTKRITGHVATVVNASGFTSSKADGTAQALASANVTQSGNACTSKITGVMAAATLVAGNATLLIGADVTSYITVDARF